MPTTYKVLGQTATTTATTATLYTVPSATSAVCSTLVATNRGAAASAFRIAVQPGGATLEDKHYIVYDNNLQGNDAVFLTIGVTLAATDVISVFSSTDAMSFNLYGSEIT